jgi:hypothetical protein
MRSKADLKEEWLRCSGLSHSAEDIWLRDKVASLFDLARTRHGDPEAIGVRTESISCAPSLPLDRVPKIDEGSRLMKRQTLRLKR